MEGVTVSQIIYLIGSLRNPKVTEVAQELRRAGHEVFDDWMAAGPIADDSWRDYEKGRGRTYAEALEGYAAKHVFDFDVFHINRCTTVVLMLPAGKSGHLELGWALGRGKRGYILLDTEPERFDVMYQFADGVVSSVEELIECLKPTARAGELVPISCSGMDTAFRPVAGPKKLYYWEY
jgi:hypothetical protein